MPRQGLTALSGLCAGGLENGMVLTILVQDKAPGSHSALRCGKHRPAERVGELSERGRKAPFLSRAGLWGSETPIVAHSSRVTRTN